MSVHIAYHNVLFRDTFFILLSVWSFDNKLFGINEIEAENLDPQQKLALEVSYRALEDGGITLDSIRGTNASVYMGKLCLIYSHFNEV